jgi:hypothetical protein
LAFSVSHKLSGLSELVVAVGLQSEVLLFEVDGGITPMLCVCGSFLSLIFFLGSSESKLSCLLFAPAAFQAAVNCCFFDIEGITGCGIVSVWEIHAEAVWSWVALVDCGCIGSLGTK